MSAGPRALEGLRVVDCSRLIAGGVLATLLADHGVINNALSTLGLIRAPIPLLYNEFAVLVGLVYTYAASASGCVAGTPGSTLRR